MGVKLGYPPTYFVCFSILMLVLESASEQTLRGDVEILGNTEIGISSIEIEDLDPFKMEMKVRMVIDQSWVKTKAQLSKSSPPSQFSASSNGSLWWPGFTIENGREVKISNLVWRLDPDGRHIQRDTITVRFGCLMDFSVYPFDHQRCRINLIPKTETRSFRYKLIGEDVKSGRREILSYSEHIYVSPFSIWKISTSLKSTGMKGTNANGTRTNKLIIGINVRRLWSSYLGSYFIPMSSFVFISLLTLWLVYPKISVMVNFLNIILVNLYLVVHRSSLDIPKVYYVTALSVYSTTSLIFIILVLLVNVYVLFYIKAEEEDDEERARGRNAHDLNIRNEINHFPSTNYVINTHHRQQSERSNASRRETLSTWVLVKKKFMDRVRRNSHYALLCTWLFFNFVYWVTMLSIHYLQ